MGREVRRVPADWRHPQYEPWEKGNGFIPLMRGPYSKRVAEWDHENDAWSRGMSVNFCTRVEQPKSEVELEYERFEDWDSPRPIPADYMPEWTEEQATHCRMYEDTSEGTPISPAFATPEELARWLAENGASSFGHSTATYEQWLPICRGGWAPSMVMQGRTLMSGVEFMSRDTDGNPQGGNAEGGAVRSMTAGADEGGIAQGQSHD